MQGVSKCDGKGSPMAYGDSFPCPGSGGTWGLGLSCSGASPKKGPRGLGAPQSEEPPPPGSTLGQRVALGRMLFFEPRASVDGTVSCSRCHLPQLYGTDGLARSIGVMGRTNPRNAPTVLNAFLQFSQHWRAIGSPWRIKLRRH